MSLYENLVFHPSRCEFTVVRIDVVDCANIGMVEMVNTIVACGCSNQLRIES
jgi:hypothetical protein